MIGLRRCNRKRKTEPKKTDKLFNAELVYEDSMQPFKKHYKNEKVFVEVEPGADYWVRLTENPNSTVYMGLPQCVIEVSVDGSKTDNFLYSFMECERKKLYGKFDGIGKVNCLQFVVANKINPDIECSFEQLVQSLGQVKIDVYSAELLSRRETPTFRPQPFINSHNLTTIAAEKSVRLRLETNRWVRSCQR